MRGHLREGKSHFYFRYPPALYNSSLLSLIDKPAAGCWLSQLSRCQGDRWDFSAVTLAFRRLGLVSV